MTRKSLQYELLEKLNLDNYENNNTSKAYKTDIKAFAAFAKKHGYKTMGALGDARKVLQEYSEHLQSVGYSPSTIHRKLSSPCVTFKVNMREIQKPKRTADKITRGRRKEANKQGKAQMKKPDFKRLVEFQRAVGIRRAELRKLTGGDIFRDSFGYLNVIVRRGKNGKKQYQRIFPENEKTVLETIANVGSNERVFSTDEMDNLINLHGIRAEVAREAYSYYSERLKSDPEYRQQLLTELRARYMLLHMDPEKTICEFMSTCEDRKPYMLRGKNKAKALKTGKPVVYDRLAIMAVSVFHLSHWRLGVTVVNYLV